VAAVSVRGTEQPLFQYETPYCSHVSSRDI
jgi:hypothetical protein